MNVCWSYDEWSLVKGFLNYTLPENIMTIMWDKNIMLSNFTVLKFSNMCRKKKRIPSLALNTGKKLIPVLVMEHRVYNKNGSIIGWLDFVLCPFQIVLTQCWQHQMEINLSQQAYTFKAMTYYQLYGKFSGMKSLGFIKCTHALTCQNCHLIDTWFYQVFSHFHRRCL